MSWQQMTTLKWSSAFRSTEMRLYIITDLTEINLQKNPANTPLQFDSLNFFAQKFTRDENERSADVGMTGKV